MRVEHIFESGAFALLAASDIACQSERGADHAQIVFCDIRDGLRRGGGRGRAGGRLRPGTRGLRLSVHGPAVQLSLAGSEPVHGAHGHCPGHAERPHGGAAARQEFPRGDLGTHHQGNDGRRLSRRGARPDRLLQIHQAGALSVQFPTAGPQYHALLASRGIARATIMGHSMGGMLAMRFALMYPDAVEPLVLVDPLGLEDWKAEGVPYATVATTYQAQLKTSFDSIKADQLRSYYHGQWKPEYDRWVAMLSGMYAGAGKERVAWNQALTSDMIYTQPVIYELGLIKSKTLLMIGGKDRTAPGANRAPAEIAARLGNYPELGRRAARSIHDATLVEFPELGHSPQVEAPEAFHKALLDGLSGAGAPK